MPAYAFAAPKQLAPGPMQTPMGGQPQPQQQPQMPMPAQLPQGGGFGGMQQMMQQRFGGMQPPMNGMFAPGMRPYNGGTMPFLPNLPRYNARGQQQMGGGQMPQFDIQALIRSIQGMQGGGQRNVYQPPQPQQPMPAPGGMFGGAGVDPMLAAQSFSNYGSPGDSGP